MDYEDIFKIIGYEEVIEIMIGLFQLQMLDDTNKDILNTHLNKKLESFPNISSKDLIDSLEQDGIISFNPNLEFNMGKAMKLFARFVK